MATSARSDRELVESWVASLGSMVTRRNFSMTAERFLEALRVPLRQATVEDVREALQRITAGAAPSSARQYTARIKSLSAYAHRLGYLPFNAGAVIRLMPEQRALAKRLLGEVEVSHLVRSAARERDYVLVAVAYATGLRVSEVVGLNCADIVARGDERLQLHVIGKGGKERDILLPTDLAPPLLALIAGRAPDDPVFVSTRRERNRLTSRAVGYLLKRLAKRAKVTQQVSPHWLRHAHASHAIDRGAPLPVVQATLGHGNIAVTSAYLHARPGTASGEVLDPAVWKQREAQ